MNRRTEEQYRKVNIRSKNISKLIHLIKERATERETLWFNYSDGKQIGVVIYPDKDYIEIGLQTVMLETTPCHFGGERYWMTCPKCGERKAVLYEVHSHYWACRTCLNLVYSSQQMTKTDYWAWFIRAEEVAKQLQPDYDIKKYTPAFGFYPPYPTKPKYMKRSKYNEHLAKFDKYIRRGHKESFKSIGNILGSARHDAYTQQLGKQVKEEAKRL